MSTVGEGDAIDFTAVGDTINTAARLMDSASTGEIVISATAAEAASLDTSCLEARSLTLRGREEIVEAWIQGANSALQAMQA